MAKAKIAGENGAAEGIEFMFKGSADAFKDGYEKAVKGYDQLVGYGKETTEACLKAATTAGKGVETLHDEIYTYSKAAVEDTLAQTKALMGTKSVSEAFELQSGFAKSAFDSYVTEVSKISELMLATTKQTFEPFQGRFAAWMEMVQSTRAV
jgi:phasin family protein